MSGRIKEFVVLCAYLPEGADVPDVAALTEVLDVSGAEYWIFTQPGTFLAYFRKERRGVELADKAEKAISGLKNTRQDLREIRIGRAEGRLVADFSWFGFGKAKFMPLGEAVIQAQNNARGK